MTRITGHTPPSAPVTSEKAATPRTEAPASAAPAAKGWGPSSTSASARVSPVATPQTPAEVATAFYAAFQKQDVAAMQKLYAPDATFKDPIYDLKGSGEVGHMWGALFKAGTDLKVNFKVLESGPEGAKVQWIADYKVFGRPVHNECVGNLTVKDGKITAHRDDWSWSKWARQALPLGPLVDVPPIKAALLFFMRRA